MQERDKNSLNNLLLLKGELGCICIDCNDKDWIFPLIVICQDEVAAKIYETMLKWDNSIREEYGQELNKEKSKRVRKWMLIKEEVDAQYKVMGLGQKRENNDTIYKKWRYILF